MNNVFKHQSHHSGIEMSISSPLIVATTMHQSHHSGIEMAFTFPADPDYPLHQSHHSGIEMVIKFVYDELLKCTNRTIMELKLMNH